MANWIIDELALEEIALGCAFLGSGGGGAIAFDLPQARLAIKQYGPVRVVSLADLNPQALIAPIGFIGAPIEPSEHIAGQNELNVLLHAVEDYFKQPIGAIIPLEIGGGNGLSPLIHASRLNSALLDADTIGRAFPKLHMTSCALRGYAPSPAFLADAKGTCVIIKAPDAEITEKMARALTSASGSVMALSTYFVTKEQAVDALIHNSYSQARVLGKALLSGQIPGTWLTSGSIKAINLCLDGGFIKGQFCIDVVTIGVQNEFLLAVQGHDVLATTPDIIAIIDSNTLRPLALEEIAEGVKVHLYTYPAPTIWQSPQGLQVAGYDVFKQLMKPK